MIRPKAVSLRREYKRTRNFLASGSALSYVAFPGRPPKIQPRELDLSRPSPYDSLMIRSLILLAAAALGGAFAQTAPLPCPAPAAGEAKPWLNSRYTPPCRARFALDQLKTLDDKFAFLASGGFGPPAPGQRNLMTEMGLPRTGAALAGGVALAAQDEKPPLKLLFPSKAGDVPFDHAAHLAREKGECASCHEKLWPKSAKDPLKSSAGCKTCHQPGGRAFEMKDNCKKCHPAADGGAGSK